MLSQKYLKSVYGPAAAFSEYLPGDAVRYLDQGQKRFGLIRWVCAPSALIDRYIGILYVVQSQGNGQLDLVSPANVLTPSEEAPGWQAAR